MAKTVELLRHTDNDGDVLTVDGVRAAVEIGRRLEGPYRVLVSSGAQRATQTAACILAGLGEAVADGTLVEPLLRSETEDRWRAAYDRAGSAGLQSLEKADSELVAEDSARLAGGLRRIFELIDEGQKALAIGHSPTSEAAIYGLTGKILAPLGKGEGGRITRDADTYRVQRLDR